MTRANLMWGLALLTACSSSVPVSNAPPAPGAYGTLEVNWIGTQLITIGFGKNVIGKVQLTAGGNPVAGATITFNINGTANGSYLQQNTDTTDGDGYATVNILAGTQAASFQVGATTEGLATPKYINVDVSGKYLGNVVVRTNGYDGPGKPQFYFVRLHDANVEGAGCATFRPDQPPAAIDTQQVADIRLDTVFQNEQDGLSVYATVVGMDGTRPVVSGCGGPVTVEGENTVYIQVDLTTADAGIEGDYTFGQDITPLQYLDKDTATYAVLADITGLFQDPGLFVAGGIYTGSSTTPVGLCTLLGSNSAVESFCEAIGSEGIDYGINALIGLDKTGTAAAVKAALSNGASMLTDIHVGGVLTISNYDQTSGATTGQLVYDSYRFLWTDTCGVIGSQSTASPDPCCGHHIYTGEQLGIDPIQANFTGTATANATTGPTTPVSYNFSTQSMVLGVAYGRLGMAILEDVLLPQLEGVFPVMKTWDTGNGTYNSIPDGKLETGELVAGIINCAGADGVANGSTALCEQACDALGTLVDQIISQLQFNGTTDWNVTETVANGVLSDSDGDLQVDQLTATMQLVPEANGSSPGNIPDDPITARYRGKTCTGDGECGNGFACHFAANAIDSCFPDNACGAIIGQSAGGQACSVDTSCKSGLCMLPTGVAGAEESHADTCFQACVTDQDCLGNGHCLLGGYVSVEDTGILPGQLDPNDTVTYAGTCVSN